MRPKRHHVFNSNRDTTLQTLARDQVVQLASRSLAGIVTSTITPCSLRAKPHSNKTCGARLKSAAITHEHVTLCTGWSNQVTHEFVVFISDQAAIFEVGHKQQQVAPPPPDDAVPSRVRPLNFIYRFWWFLGTAKTPTRVPLPLQPDSRHCFRRSTLLPA